MYRYHITLSFDKKQHIVVSSKDTNTSMVQTTVPMLTSEGEFRHGLQKTINSLRKLNIFPSETGYDAIFLGLLVYIADMRISRQKQAQDSWSREIYITVPVYDSRWGKYKDTFERMLKFLTGDLWSIEFIHRKNEFSSQVNEEQKTNKYRVASLFSGGMDSLIAAINYMEHGQATLLVSHAGESRVRHWQKDLLSILDDEYGNIPHDNAYYWTTLEEIELLEGDKDKNQRSRSFLFVAIALFAMSGTRNCHQLYMPENGLIALNVPLDSSRIGSHSTRTTHPFYMRLWNEVVSDIFGYSISNPYWNKTKGEMAAECLNKDVLKIAMELSYSCSSVNSVSMQSGKSNHCGHCLPCIIRRAAMHYAFDDFDPSTYMDVNVTNLVNNRGTKGEHLRAFQYAIERLKKNPKSKNFLIHKPGPLDMYEEYLNELANVYYRGLMEVDQWIQDSLEKENVV